MLTRALLLLTFVCGLAAPALAEEPKLVAFGLTDHQVTQEELEKGATLPVPKFNTPAVAYALIANLNKGDVVEVALATEEKPLLTNSQTLDQDQARFLLQAGKTGVPAGGWPQEWKYFPTVKLTRDGKTLIEQKGQPVPFE